MTNFVRTHGAEALNYEFLKYEEIEMKVNVCLEEASFSATAASVERGILFLARSGKQYER